MCISEKFYIFFITVLILFVLSNTRWLFGHFVYSLLNHV